MRSPPRSLCTITQLREGPRHGLWAGPVSTFRSPSLLPETAQSWSSTRCDFAVIQRACFKASFYGQPKDSLGFWQLQWTSMKTSSSTSNRSCVTARQGMVASASTTVATLHHDDGSGTAQSVPSSDTGLQHFEVLFPDEKERQQMLCGLGTYYDCHAGLLDELLIQNELGCPVSIKLKSSYFVSLCARRFMPRSSGLSYTRCS